jgi:hypothetical protein
MIHNRFELLETLSRRNSVQTYKCQDAELGLIVLKVFESVSEQQRSQLQQLSKSLLRLSHSGLQEHLGIFEDDKQVSLAFRWIEGLTLAQEIIRGVRYTDEELFGFMGQALEALAVAHGLNPALIHRDIKPENIVRTAEHWVLIDFGASREAVLGDGEASVIGTTGYAAPEQFYGQALPASDQYGLAATTLHLATHRHPTDFPLRKLELDLEKAGLSRGLQKVLDRMLSPDPQNRFLNAEIALKAVVDRSGMEPWEFALEPIADTQTVLKAQSNDDEVAVMIGARSNKLLLSLAIIALISAIAFFFFFFVFPLVFLDFESPLMILAFALTPFTVFHVIPMITREWAGRRVWLLTLTPIGFRLERDGKPFYEGSQPREVIQKSVMDQGLNRRSPLALRHLNGISKTFGYSMNSKESEVLKEIVESYYEQVPAEPTKRIHSDSQALVVGATDFMQTQKRPNPLRFLSSCLQSVRELPATPKRRAVFQAIPASARELFEEHGFKSVGYLKEESILRLFGNDKEVLLSDDGAVVMHASPGVHGESDSDFTYSLSSMTVDGRCRITWSHRTPDAQSTELVVSAGSKGSFRADLEAHRAWLTATSEELGTNPVRIVSMEDRIAAAKYMARHMESVSTSLTRLAIGVTLVGNLVGIVYFIQLLFFASLN